MAAPSRQSIVLAVILLMAAGGMFTVIRSKPSGASVGFWFDPIGQETLTSVPERLGTIGPGDLKVIETVAFAELGRAFRDFQIEVTPNRDAAYRVRVVERLRNPLAPKMLPLSGASRSIPGLGGQGAVSFSLFAHNAVAYSPADADRSSLIAAMGRGIGRAAAHEFAHQFLGSIDIHAERDVRSYEYRSADRIEQYYGDMRWGTAGPLIAKRMGWNRSSITSRSR